MTGHPAARLESRFYRAALRLCPAAFHSDHGEEMACDFDEARGAAAVAGSRAVWTLRLMIVLDLVRTIGVQWLRTGLPAIAGVAACISLGLVASIASMGRWLAGRVAIDHETSEGVGFVLLSSVAVLVIVTTIVFNHWMQRPRRTARR